MIKVEKSVFINKPVEEVFAFVTGEGNYTKWQPGVSEVIDLGPRNTVGARYIEVRKFMGREMRSTFETIEFVPNARWVGRVVEGPVKYEVTITYAAEGGGTKYTTQVSGEPSGFFKLAEGLVAGQLEKSLIEDLQRLKEMLEK
jgi:uncharacterized protein YndB with AHSA1/START domain